MNITDIAGLAGVSVSTVSKVMNGKDESISSATRDKVLKLAKEYNYSPYSSFLSSAKQGFNIAMVTKGFDYSFLIIDGILDEAKKSGYSLFLNKAESSSEEARALSLMEKNAPSGIIFEKKEASSEDMPENLVENDIPYLTFSPFSPSSLNTGLNHIAYNMTAYLCSLGHKNIICLSDGNSEKGKAFFSGYSKCLFESHIPYTDNTYKTMTPELFAKLKTESISAIICEDYRIALKTYSYLEEMKYSIPDDISIISACDLPDDTLLHPHISTVRVPYKEFGKYLCQKIINIIEKKEKQEVPFYESVFPSSLDAFVENKASISLPFNLRKKKILVVGSINIDNYMNFSHLPASGMTVSTTVSSFYPGGKGTNTAVGASKLGHDVELIGAVGCDADSEIILKSLNDNGIKHGNLRRFGNAQTGKAFIFLEPKGESIISILSGANAKITADFIESSEKSFENTDYCLLDTEIPFEAVITACRLAHKYGAKTVLKPSSCLTLSDELLSLVDILVPNLHELNEMYPKAGSTEERLEKLLSSGVKTVVLTSGADGSILKTDKLFKKFDASDFNSIDSTGACDAFISALASYLSYGYDIESGVKIATFAAGFAISREGVVPALVDRNTLESYIQSHEPGLIK